MRNNAGKEMLLIPCLRDCGTRRGAGVKARLRASVSLWLPLFDPVDTPRRVVERFVFADDADAGAFAEARRIAGDQDIARLQAGRDADPAAVAFGAERDLAQRRDSPALVDHPRRRLRGLRVPP